MGSHRVAHREIAAKLASPPAKSTTREYTLDEVRYRDELRSKVPGVELPGITFDLGSAQIQPDHQATLTEVAAALAALIADNPGELFLIEGHADAVGSGYANLIISDRRAEAIATVLTRSFNIPPENLIAQGYGDRQPKVQARGAERQNRRIVIRRITPLVEESAAALRFAVPGEAAAARVNA